MVEFLSKEEREKRFRETRIRKPPGTQKCKVRSKRACAFKRSWLCVFDILGRTQKKIVFYCQKRKTSFHLKRMFTKEDLSQKWS